MHLRKNFDFIKGLGHIFVDFLSERWKTFRSIVIGVDSHVELVILVKNFIHATFFSAKHVTNEGDFNREVSLPFHRLFLRNCIRNNGGKLLERKIILRLKFSKKIKLVYKDSYLKGTNFRAY